MNDHQQDKIIAQNSYTTSKYYRLLLLLLSLFVIAVNLYSSKWLYAFVGVIMAYLATVNKQILLTKNMIVITVTALFYKHKQELRYNDFDLIEAALKKNMYHIYFVKSTFVREIKIEVSDFSKFDSWIKSLGLNYQR